MFFVCTCLIFSQGRYLSRENGLSLGFLYGRSQYGNNLSFTGSYSLSGFIDLSYAHSTFLDERKTNNFQDEYFIRAYILKEKLPFFFSGSAGYIYNKTEYDLWKDFPLRITQEGFAYELGMHLTSIRKDNRNPKIVVSIIYRYFNPEETTSVPEQSVMINKFIRSLTAEAALIYYFSNLGIVIGPRFVADNDFKYELYGFDLTFILRY